MNEQHPFFAKVQTQTYRFIESWREWKDLWEKTNHLEMIQSLLHFGFKVDVRNEAEDHKRLSFYLDVANGHLSTDTFHTPKLYPAYNSSASIRTPLGRGWPEGAFYATTQRAFAVLCQEVFRAREERGESQVPGLSYNPHWTTYVYSPKTLDKLLWFFRLNDEADGRHRFFNLHGYSSLEVSKHNIEIARKFAYDLARFIFRYNSEGSREDQIRSMLNKRKPKAVDLLAGLDKLDLLLHKDYFPCLDEASVTRVKELAMQMETSSDYPREIRRVKTLDESALAGSKAARVSLVLQVMTQEQDRLNRLRNLEYQRREAEQELKKLER